MKKKYKHIFFDLDHTLWDFEANSAAALELTFQQFRLGEKGFHFNHFHDVYVRYNDKLWIAYRQNAMTKQDLIRQRFQLTFDELGIRNVDPVNFNNVFLELMPYQKLLLPGALEVLDYLNRKNYQLYIITNGFKEVQSKKMELTGISHYFKKVFISEEIKVQKPSKEIFEYAIKSANARKKESIMIGDSWDVDIIGAVKAGIDQVFLTSSKMDVESIATYKISTLFELFTIL